MTLPHAGSLEYRVGLRFRDGKTAYLDCCGESVQGRDPLWRFEGDGISVDVSGRAALDGEGLILDYAWQYEPDRFGDVESVILFETEFAAGAFERVYQARREVWLPPGIRYANGEKHVDGPDPQWDADNLMALFSPGDSALLAGVLFPCHYGLEIAYRDHRLQVRLPLTVGLPAHGRFCCDSVVLRWSAPLAESLQWYGQLNRIGLKRSVHRPVLRVWNSWDWYGADITQELMLEALDQIRSDPDWCNRFNAIALDDGWAPRGDWTEPNDRFPDLSGMAKAISDAGYVPGIWVAPLRVSKSSRWLTEHPETALWGEPRGLYPEPLTKETPDWALDYSHPLVQEKIYNDFRWLYKQGFRYYKTDFLQRPNSNFRYPDLYNPDVTPVEGLRQLIQIIRAAIGEDSYLLACGTEIAPVAGVADAARIGDDINQSFSTMQICVRNAATYFWANGNLWINDPDFLVVRGKDTQDSPFLRLRAEREQKPSENNGPYQRSMLCTGPIVDLEECRCWANFHIVYGGAPTWSDPPEKLNEAGRDMVKKVFDHAAPGTAGFPLDFDENPLPRKWLRASNGGWLLGCFNWGDAPETYRLSQRDLARMGPVRAMTDIWSEAEQAWPGDAFSLELPPHTSRVFRLSAL